MFLLDDAAWDHFHASLATLRDRVRAGEGFASALYAALCNMRSVHPNHDEPVSLSWRHAGRIVAELHAEDEAERANASYLDFYCSGNEGIVSRRAADALAALRVSGGVGEDRTRASRGCRGRPLSVLVRASQAVASGVARSWDLWVEVDAGVPRPQVPSPNYPADVRGATPGASSAASAGQTSGSWPGTTG